MIAMNNVEALQIFQRSVKLFNKSSRSFLVNGADSEEHSEFDRLGSDRLNVFTGFHFNIS